MRIWLLRLARLRSNNLGHDDDYYIVLKHIAGQGSSALNELQNYFQIDEGE